MQKISEALEAIAATVEKGSDLVKIAEAIKSAKSLAQDSKKNLGQEEASALGQLETELSTWHTKLSVILADDSGKKGMAKHARFWAEKLRQANVQ